MKKKVKSLQISLWMVQVQVDGLWTKVYYFEEKYARIFFATFNGTKVQPQEIIARVEAFSAQSPKRYFELGKEGKEIVGIRRFK